MVGAGVGASGGFARETIVAVHCYGLRLGISFDDASLLANVIECLPPGWTSIRPGNLDREYRIETTRAGSEDGLPPGARLFVGDELATWGPVVDSVLESLESQLQMYVAEFATPHLFVHSGVVEWNGRAIVLPGSSFAGKSTLVAALVEAGATYFSDEYAVFDAKGQVLPYRRRISLRAGPLGPSQRLVMSRADLAEGAGDAGIPVGVVLLTRYTQGSPWECAPVTRGSAILAMCEQTVAIRRRPADTLAILGKVADVAPVFKGSRGDLESAVSFLLGAV